jgi:hypothetical protein
MNQKTGIRDDHSRPSSIAWRTNFWLEGGGPLAAIRSRSSRASTRNRSGSGRSERIANSMQTMAS